MTIPTYGNKYDAESVFTPTDDAHNFGENTDTTVPPAIILSFQDELFDKAREVVGDPISTHGMTVHPINETVGVAGDLGMGAPLLAGGTERLIAAGVTTLCIVGGCGSLQRSVDPGDTIIPTKAIRDEGTSYHYIPPEQEATPDSTLTKQLEETFTEAEIPTHTGTVWTTDAFYRETVAEVRHFSEQGVLSVEMEAAALFAVAEFHDVDAAAVLEAHDYVIGDEWETRDDRDNFFAGMLDPAVEALEKHSNASE